MNRRAGRDAAVWELVEEVILTFRQLRAASAQIHGEGKPMPGERGVLVDLARAGPMTVPRMARARGVSRQHVQALVNRFQRLGLVRLVDNPAHRRSRLVGLTAEGEAEVRAMLGRERGALRSLPLTLAPPMIRTATAVLQALRQHLQELPGARGEGPSRGASREAASD